MRRSDIINAVAALVLTGAAAFAAPPERVVSLNLCTDQLALMLGQPGQLVSVSSLAHDPRSSAMVTEAADIPANNGSAEAVVLLEPDLVLAGTWTTRATVQMLERLGHRVEIFAPVNTFDDVRTNILRMGDLLGAPDRAAEIVAQFDAGLATLSAQTTGPAPRVAMYYALGYTAGSETLPGHILRAAGMANIAEEKALPYGGNLSLEELLLSDPDLILVGRPYKGHARATELLTHPALTRTGGRHIIESGPSWTCETLHILDAIREMIALRVDWQATQ